MLQNMTRVIKHHRKTVIGVDCTFNIGEVYVKTTVYKKPCLVGKTIGDHPIFVGSLFSIQGSYEIYHQFFSHLSMKLSSLGPGIIFGTDGKIPLVSAIMKCFQTPTMLRRTKYPEDNVQDYVCQFFSVWYLHVTNYYFLIYHSSTKHLTIYKCYVAPLCCLI